MFLYEESPYPTGDPEGSELTKSSRTCVAATLGALPGALIKLTCALITPGLSPLSSSVESCLFHPRPSRSKPPRRHRATVLFADREHAVSLWGGYTRGNRIKPDSALHRRPIGKGCTANITPLCLSPQLGRGHPQSTSFAPQREHNKSWHKCLLYFHEKVIPLCTCIN